MLFLVCSTKKKYAHQLNKLFCVILSSTTALELLIGYFITNICKIVVNIFLAVEDENNMAGMLCAVFGKIVNKYNVRYMRALNLTTEIFPLESTHETENGSYILKLSNCFCTHA